MTLPVYLSLLTLFPFDLVHNPQSGSPFVLFSNVTSVTQWVSQSSLHVWYVLWWAQAQIGRGWPFIFSWWSRSWIMCAMIALMSLSSSYSLHSSVVSLSQPFSCLFWFSPPTSPLFVEQLGGFCFEVPWCQVFLSFGLPFLFGIWCFVFGAPLSSFSF